MNDPLSFLKKLRSADPPPVVHLVGDDDWLRETVLRRIVTAWCGEEGSRQIERLVGTDGIERIQAALGSDSLFARRKVVILADPSPGEKGKNLSGLGKKQIETLQKTVRNIPADLNRLVIVTSSLKPNGSVFKRLGTLATQVDVSTPTGPARRDWVRLIAKRVGVRLDREVTEVLSSVEVPLGTVVADLEKLALAVPEGAEAGLELWKNLSQADPEVTVWKIGDHLGGGRTGDALCDLRILRQQGLSIHEILPSLLSWNQQRLRVKSFLEAGRKETPEGIHAFVVKKTRQQVRKRSLTQLRREQRELFYLDRASKQNWESPEILLETFLVKTSAAGGEE